VKANQDHYKVRLMCRMLQVSVSGFYAWRERPLSARARADIALLAKIHEIHRHSKGRYGAHGIHVGCKRVAWLMRENGIRSIIAPSFVVTTTANAAATLSEDLVNRQFKADGPDQLWVAGVAYIPTWAGFLYLAIVLDVFTRKIVGWAIEDHLRTQLVLAALNTALAQRQPSGVIHHSDHGCQGGFNWSAQQ